MELEEFLKEKGILRAYCENMRAFMKDSRYNGGSPANMDSFEWTKTPQGYDYWITLYYSFTKNSSNTCDYFANHPILKDPPKCLKRL